ncbi:RNA polymerase subunit sigma-70 [Pseudonocardia sp. DLS-67]
MTAATDGHISGAVAAAQAGDQAAFAALAEPHRQELHVHCYRMLGSFTDAEDMVQEALLRAWRRRETYAGRSTFRAWLYRIATNACLDHLERHPRRPAAAGEVTWLQPFPDRLLEQAAPDAEPDVAVVARETIELAFLVAVQHLPPRQRAVLMLRDVLGWSAAESAAVLGSSVASVNSALQRARATLREHLPRRRSEWSAASHPSDEERSVLQRFMDACERADMPALASLLREDAVFSMPPQPEVTRGRDEVLELWAPALAGVSELGTLLLVPVWLNRQPAAANYVRRPGDPTFRALAVDVLRVEDGVITDVMSFEHTATFPVFDLLDLPATR